jgi:hypothetical protein
VKIIETTAKAVAIAECNEPLTIDMIDNPSPYGPKIVIRELMLQPRRDLAGRPCWSAYDRKTDTLYVRFQP